MSGTPILQEATSDFAPLRNNMVQLESTSTDILAFSKGVDKYCEQEGIKQDYNSLSPGLKQILRSLGMREESFAGWRQLHVSPARAMAYFFCPVLVMLGGLSYVQLVGVPLTRYYFSIPCSIALVVTSAYPISLWIFGPSVARSRAYCMSLPISWCSWFITFTVSFLGPLENMPFGSVIQYLLFVAMFVFCGNLANKAGAASSPRLLNSVVLSHFLYSRAFLVLM